MAVSKMAINKFRPHLFIVPEDDADRQIAVGFQLHLEVEGEIQIVSEAGGWLKVIQLINDEYVSLLEKNDNAHVLGILDCDGDAARIKTQLESIPENVRDRVFLLGVNEDPQAFKRVVRMHFSEIGEKLAEECYRNETELWNHEMLSYCADEASRASAALRELLFTNKT